MGVEKSRSRQARKDSNPQHPVLETSALPIGATGLFASRYKVLSDLFDLCFAMQGMLTLERTILAQLELTLRITTIILSSIVFLFTFGALQSNFLYGTFFLCFTHFMLLGEYSPYITLFRDWKIKKPSNGLEPLTPTLPWWCSTAELQGQ